eukprot:gene5832-11775_t
MFFFRSRFIFIFISLSILFPTSCRQSVSIHYSGSDVDDLYIEFSSGSEAHPPQILTSSHMLKLRESARSTVHGRRPRSSLSALPFFRPTSKVALTLIRSSRTYPLSSAHISKTLTTEDGDDSKFIPQYDDKNAINSPCFEDLKELCALTRYSFIKHYQLSLTWKEISASNVKSTLLLNPEYIPLPAFSSIDNDHIDANLHSCKLANDLYVSGKILLSKNRPETAKQLFSVAKKLFIQDKNICESKAQSLQLRMGMEYGIGVAAMHMAQLPEARTSFYSVLKLMSSVNDSNSDNNNDNDNDDFVLPSHGGMLLIHILNSLSTVERRLGNFDTAASHMRRVIAQYESKTKTNANSDVNGALEREDTLRFASALRTLARLQLDILGRALGTASTSDIPSKICAARASMLSMHADIESNYRRHTDLLQSVYGGDNDENGVGVGVGVGVGMHESVVRALMELGRATASADSFRMITDRLCSANINDDVDVDVVTHSNVLEKDTSDNSQLLTLTLTTTVETTTIITPPPTTSSRGDTDIMSLSSSHDIESSASIDPTYSSSSSSFSSSDSDIDIGLESISLVSSPVSSSLPPVLVDDDDVDDFSIISRDGPLNETDIVSIETEVVEVSEGENGCGGGGGGGGGGQSQQEEESETETESVQFPVSNTNTNTTVDTNVRNTVGDHAIVSSSSSSSSSVSMEGSEEDMSHVMTTDTSPTEALPVTLPVPATTSVSAMAAALSATTALAATLLLKAQIGGKTIKDNDNNKNKNTDNLTTVSESQSQSSSQSQMISLTVDTNTIMNTNNNYDDNDGGISNIMTMAMAMLDTVIATTTTTSSSSRSTPRGRRILQQPQPHCSSMSHDTDTEEDLGNDHAMLWILVTLGSIMGSFLWISLHDARRFVLTWWRSREARRIEGIIQSTEASTIELLSKSLYAEAESVLVRALSEVMRHKGETHPDTAHLLYFLGQTQFNMKKYEEAENTLSKVLYCHSLLGEDIHTARVRESMAEVLLAVSRPEEATTLLSVALDIYMREGNLHRQNNMDDDDNVEDSHSHSHSPTNINTSEEQYKRRLLFRSLSSVSTVNGNGSSDLLSMQVIEDGGHGGIHSPSHSHSHAPSHALHSELDTDVDIDIDVDVDVDLPSVSTMSRTDDIYTPVLHMYGIDIGRVHTALGVCFTERCMHHRAASEFQSALQVLQNILQYCKKDYAESVLRAVEADVSALEDQLALALSRHSMDESRQSPSNYSYSLSNKYNSFNNMSSYGSPRSNNNGNSQFSSSIGMKLLLESPAALKTDHKQGNNNNNTNGGGGNGNNDSVDVLLEEYLNSW